MIERYSNPQMKKIWSEENKFEEWLKVEIAACEAWAEIGAIPSEALTKLRKATCNPERVAEILKVTHHDMTAFIRTVAESLGDEGRFIHLGLTSSDRSLLSVIIEKFGGGPTGLNTLAAATGEEEATIEEVSEPFLIQLGLLERTSRGRMATPRAYEHLGFELPADRQEKFL